MTRVLNSVFADTRAVSIEKMKRDTAVCADLREV